MAVAEYATSIEIEAPPTRVFDFLVTEEGMTAWMGQHATLSPEPGGQFAVDIAGHAIRGRYLTVERPHLVVVSWGVTASADLPPGASTVEFRLTPIARGTRVDLVHSGLPDTELDGHADGWAHFLPRLQTVATGGDAGPDHWQPGVPRDRRPTAERIRAVLADRPATREVAMFGGLSFMVNDKMIINVRGSGDLLVRVDPHRSPELVADHGARPAEMGAGRSMGPGWLDVSAACTTSDDQLRFWIDVAMAFNEQATAHPGRRARRRVRTEESR